MIATWMFLFFMTFRALAFVGLQWNMNGPSIAASAPPLIKYFRANGHPSTPIVLAEGTPAGGEWLLPGTSKSMEAKRAALRGAYEAAAPSDPNLHYVNASQLWPKHWHESPTVAGCHPTDEGGELVAEFYTKMIPQWIAAVPKALPQHCGATDCSPCSFGECRPPCQWQGPGAGCMR